MLRVNKETKYYYNSWTHIIRRCTNPKEKTYKNYGGRGITVFSCWLPQITKKGPNIGFVQFYNWIQINLGPRPLNMTLDRIDNNGNYEPGNLRWATPKQQTINRRNSIVIEYNGIKKSLIEWCDDYGLPLGAIKQRYYNHYPIDELFIKPIRNADNWNKKFYLNSEEWTVEKLSLKTGINKNTIWGRIRNGWSIARILNTPLQNIHV